MRWGLVFVWTVAATLAWGTAFAQSGMPSENVAWASVKLAHLVFGLIGVACALAMVEWNWGTVATTSVLGLGFAIVGTPAIVHYLFDGKAVFQGYENAIAFACGVFGFLVLPVAKKLLEQIGKDPLAFYQQWRRGASAGPAQPPQQGQGGQP